MSILSDIADMARPYCIYAIGSSIAIAPYFHGIDGVVFGIVATAFGGLIGMRGYENVVQTKATASTMTASTTTASGSTQTVEVKTPSPTPAT